MSTVHEDGFQVEQSADNFITTVPWGVDLCKRLGLGDQLVQTNPAYRRTFVVRRGRLYQLPDGFLMMAPTRLWPLAVTPILSPLGKLRAAWNTSFRRGRPTATRAWPRSSAAGWAARCSTGWSSRWSARSTRPTWRSSASMATLSRFREMEREHGSLIRAMRHQMKKAAQGAARRQRRPLQHVRHAARRAVEPGRCDRRAAAARARCG